MLSGMAADLLVALHFAFILFVVLGGLLVLRWSWLAWLHLPAAVWGALIELVGWTCPLTPLENRLRVMAGQEGYTRGFIEEYLAPLIYPPGLAPALQLYLGLAVVLINLVVYVFVLRRIRRR